MYFVGHQINYLNYYISFIFIKEISPIQLFFIIRLFFIHENFKILFQYFFLIFEYSQDVIFIFFGIQFDMMYNFIVILHKLSRNFQSIKYCLLILLAIKALQIFCLHHKNKYKDFYTVFLFQHLEYFEIEDVFYQVKTFLKFSKHFLIFYHHRILFIQQKDLETLMLNLTKITEMFLSFFIFFFLLFLVDQSSFQYQEESYLKLSLD